MMRLSCAGHTARHLEGCPCRKVHGSEGNHAALVGPERECPVPNTWVQANTPSFQTFDNEPAEMLSRAWFECAFIFLVCARLVTHMRGFN